MGEKVEEQGIGREGERRGREEGRGEREGGKGERDEVRRLYEERAITVDIIVYTMIFISILVLVL